jgi:hypothetical protein
MPRPKGRPGNGTGFLSVSNEGDDMLKSRYRRFAAAMLASASLAGMFAITAGPASAAFVGIKCTGLTGTVSGTIQATGCNGNTGGSSVPQSTSSLISGGVVHWVNGKTTTIGAATTSSTETDSDAPPKAPCPAGTSETSAKGSVTADTTGSAPVPGTYKVEVCVDGSGNITIEPGSKLKIG